MPAVVLAIVAAVSFGAGLFNIHLGTISWLYLGLTLLAFAAAYRWWLLRRS
jgi:hypothetical protein